MQISSIFFCTFHPLIDNSVLKLLLLVNDNIPRDLDIMFYSYCIVRVIYLDMAVYKLIVIVGVKSCHVIICVVIQ